MRWLTSHWMILVITFSNENNFWILKKFDFENFADVWLIDLEYWIWFVKKKFDNLFAQFSFLDIFYISLWFRHFYIIFLFLAMNHSKLVQIEWIFYIVNITFTFFYEVIVSNNFDHFWSDYRTLKFFKYAALMSSPVTITVVSNDLSLPSNQK